MTRNTAALLAVCGLPLAGAAVENTRVDWQVSTDFVNWSSDVAAPRGQQVWVRALVTYTGTPHAYGLASLSFQPIVSNWDAAGASVDQVIVATGSSGFPCATACEIECPDDPAQFGRVMPFKRCFTGTNAMYGHVHVDGSGGAPPGTWLRIAMRQATTWCGPGSTSGGPGAPLAQLSNVGRTTSDPTFDPRTDHLLIYRFGIVLSSDATPRTLTIDSPPGCFGNRNPFTGEREVYWWGDMNEPTGSLRGTAFVVPATIHVQPCGTADFNCDGDTGTDADIESFFACLAGNCPTPPCASNADFNGDGDTATDADIEAFFRVLAGGAC